jgi:hypothetical protein
MAMSTEEKTPPRSRASVPTSSELLSFPGSTLQLTYGVESFWAWARARERGVSGRLRGISCARWVSIKRTLTLYPEIAPTADRPTGS